MIEDERGMRRWNEGSRALDRNDPACSKASTAKADYVSISYIFTDRKSDKGSLLHQKDDDGRQPVAFPVSHPLDFQSLGRGRFLEDGRPCIEFGWLRFISLGHPKLCGGTVFKFSTVFTSPASRVLTTVHLVSEHDFNSLLRDCLSPRCCCWVAERIIMPEFPPKGLFMTRPFPHPFRAAFVATIQSST